MVKQSALIYFFLVFTTFFHTLAQDTQSISFEKTEHDFGEIKEENGPVTYEFIFENQSQVPLVLSNVRASCGCTTPSWTKEPIAPGEKGSITARYNPRNRPGSFRKTLTITHNGTEGSSRLYIKGKVLPRVKTIEERLPFIIGNTRMKSRTVNFGRINTKGSVTKKVEIHNGGIDTLRFEEGVKLPKHISMEFPDHVAPDTIGEIKIMYDPVEKGELGYYTDGIEFKTNETSKNVKSLNVYATISEYFAPMSEEEKATAPVLHVVDRMKDIGNIQQGDLETTFFVLQNDGKSNLNIRKVQSNCNCVKVSVEKKNIAPGESTNLKVIFDSTKRRGRQTKSISIYSNDPNDPTQVVTVMTSIVESK